MLEALEDPSKITVTGRAAQLHPRSLKYQGLKRIAWGALFFGSLLAVFVLLIWLANRYPAAPTQPHRSYRGEMR